MEGITLPFFTNGISSVGRALVSKTRCQEFESLIPCKPDKKSLVSIVIRQLREDTYEVGDQIIVYTSLIQSEILNRIKNIN